MIIISLSLKPSFTSIVVSLNIKSEILGALQDVLQAFREPINVRRLDEARDQAGNDMLRAMQTVFPVASQIQMKAIEKYGFPSDGDGRVLFFLLF